MNATERGLLAAVALSGVAMLEVCPQCGGTSDRCDDVQGGACLTCCVGTILAPAEIVTHYRTRLEHQAERYRELEAETRVLRPLAPDHDTDTWHLDPQTGRVTLTRRYSASHTVSTSDTPAGSSLAELLDVMRRLREGLPISWHLRQPGQARPLSRIYLRTELHPATPGGTL